MSDECQNGEIDCSIRTVRKGEKASLKLLEEFVNQSINSVVVEILVGSSRILFINQIDSSSEFFYMGTSGLPMLLK